MLGKTERLLGELQVGPLHNMAGSRVGSLGSDPLEGTHNSRRGVSLVVKYPSANPKVPGLIPGLVLLLEWPTTYERLWI